MDAVLLAIAGFADPLRLLTLLAGVLIGLVVGVIPGIGGVFGLTLLVPITYTLEPSVAITLLLAMVSVTTTSDTIPAVLMGVPGTVGSAATVLDGHALAQKNQAARALGAAYSASLIGGLFGALVLALSIPILRPLVTFLNFGDLFAITAFGLTLVVLLSGRNILKGLSAALLGLLVSFVGLDPYEGVERWSMGEVYLWEGIPVAIVFLGLFGVSELADLSQRKRIQTSAADPDRDGLRHGVAATLKSWPLVLRSSSIGAFLGAVPGVGITVIEWIVYGDAARRQRGSVPFGKGNIRGVIAPESANNAKESGSLMPTVAFGIPGSATAAILLGAFSLHGIVPGPALLNDGAPLVVSMILTIAAANVLGALICMGMTPTLASIARIPSATLVPVTLVFVTLGAFQSGRDPRDLVVLLIFGALGILMKRCGWSRPAFALGFVLGPNLERFFFLSYQISGWDWLVQPMVLIFFFLGCFTLLRATHRRGTVSRASDGAPPRQPDLILATVVLLAFASAFLSTFSLPFNAAMFPRLTTALGVAITVLLITSLRSKYPSPNSAQKWRYKSDIAFFAVATMAAVLILAAGHIFGTFLFLICALWFSGNVTSTRILILATLTTLACEVIFDLALPRTWPTPILLEHWSW